MVERGLTAEGRTEEFGLPTFPSRRFVPAGGLTVVHEGLLEYELVDIAGRRRRLRPAAGTLALTLLRATGMLSRLGMSSGRCRPGPWTPSTAPRCSARSSHATPWPWGTHDPYALADDVLVPLQVTASFGGGDRPARGTRADRRRGRGLLGAPGGRRRSRCGCSTRPTADTTVTVPGRSGWLVDLRGRPVAPFEGSFALRPHGIATARLDGR